MSGPGSRLCAWARRVFRRRVLEREMREEIAFHLDARARALEAAGLPAAEARRQARVEFGGEETHKDGMRRALGLAWLDSLRADLRYGARMLRKSPGFTAVAAGSLALAIGANTAVFSAANRLIYAKLGVPRPSELRLLALDGPSPLMIHGSWGTSVSNGKGGRYLDVFTYPVFKQLQHQAQSTRALAGFKDLYRVNVTAAGQAQVVAGELVSGNFYKAMEIKPQLGRAILPADDAVPDAGAVAVISDGLWHRSFGASPAVVGQVLRVNGILVTIVGVNPREYTGVGSARAYPDLVMPLSMVNLVNASGGTRHGGWLSDSEEWWVNAIARRKAGVPDATAQAELNALFKAAVRGTTRAERGEHIPTVLLEDGSRGLNLFGRFQASPLWVLLAMTGLVVLLACTNIANLMLARATVREREMAVRLALGASKARVLRQVLTESLMIAGLGGSLGLLIAFLPRNFFVRLLVPASSADASTLEAPFDWKLFSFIAAIALITGLLFGIFPAWRATRAEVNAKLKEVGQSATRRRKAWSGRGLVAIQIMLSTVLVAGAALFARTLANLADVDPGFRTDHLLAFDVATPETRYKGRDGTMANVRIEAALSGVPGVQGVAVADPPLLSQSSSRGGMRIENMPERKDGDERSSWRASVGPSFFEVMRLPILRGRAFGPQDEAGSPRVAIVNQVFVEKYLPNRNPIGVRFNGGGNEKEDPWKTIIGVCGNTRYSDVSGKVEPISFDLYRQAEDFRGGTYLVHSDLPPSTLFPSLRRAVQSVDRDLPLTDVRTMEEQIAEDVRQQRVFATLTAAFGLLALVLAVVGVYGVMAYTVAQRTHEIGIRLALGSPTGAVRWMVLRESLALGLAGAAAGLGAALALGRLVASLLYGLKPHDPLSLGLAAGVLLAAAFAAGWVPALRASRVDPMVALRHE